MVVPAVNYDYSYARQYRNNQGVARSARSNQAYARMNAQMKVTSNNATQRVRTSQAPQKAKRHNHADIDIPVITKKKVELQKPEEMKLTKPKTSAKSKQKTESAKRSIIATLFAFGMLFMICTRYAQINELSHRLNSLEKDLTSAEALNQQLTSQVDSKTDLNYIEKYAKYQLGMQKPDDKQIVRIAYDKQDKISTPIVIAEDNEPSFWEKLFNDLKHLVD